MSTPNEGKIPQRRKLVKDSIGGEKKPLMLSGAVAAR